ncbi:MAG: hypothetical protein JO276_10570 [Sphingomonadaceae bacterium]|nr:hypothetical protein [Sphingomonadaceae bacterium]
MKRLLPIIALALALGGCGLRRPLAPAEGQHMPRAPAMASRAMTTDELMAPPTTARPERLDELLQRSEERHDDRFDLPPGDIPAGNGNASANSSSSTPPPQ